MPNYTTVNEYTLTAAESDFTISFDYQKASYVSFKVEDDDLTDVTSTYTGKMIDDTTFQFQDSSGDPQDIPSGYRVTFTRDTDISDDLFTFAAGTVIRPDALGESLKTLRDYTEENVDQLSNTVITAESDAITTATADAVSAKDDAEDARDAALGYRNTAQTHKNDAETAKDAAEAAQTASESARDASQTARDASQTAQTAAETAKNAAQAALDQLNNKYHGSFASDAAVQADIEADSDLSLEAGDIYFNTTDSVLKYYDGSAWYQAAASNVIDTSSLGSINDVTFTSLGGDHFIVRSDQNTWVNVGADVVKDKLGLDSADSPTFAGLTLTGNITTSGQVDGRDVSTDGTKLDGIEANATADMTDAEIKTAYENNSDTNAFTDAEQTKLEGIEANADVTDATNVAAAGAVMDTGWSDLAAVKGINQALDTNADVDFSSVTVEKILINGRTISSTDTDGDIEITPNGDGDIKLDGQLWPRTAGSDGKFLKVSSQSTGQLEWADVAGGKYTPVTTHSRPRWATVYTQLGPDYKVFHQKDGNTQTVPIPTGAVGCSIILQAAGGNGGNATGTDAGGVRFAAPGSPGGVALSQVHKIDEWTASQRSTGFTVTFTSQGSSGACTVKHGSTTLASANNGTNGGNASSSTNVAVYAPASGSSVAYLVGYSSTGVIVAQSLGAMNQSSSTHRWERPSITMSNRSRPYEVSSLMQSSQYSTEHPIYHPFWREGDEWNQMSGGYYSASYTSTSIGPYLYGVNSNQPDADQNSMLLGEPGLAAGNYNQQTTYTGGRGGPAGAIFVWYYD